MRDETQNLDPRPEFSVWLTRQPSWWTGQLANPYNLLHNTNDVGYLSSVHDGWSCDVTINLFFILVASLQWISQHWPVCPTAKDMTLDSWLILVLKAFTETADVVESGSPFHWSVTERSVGVISDHLLPWNPPTPWFPHHSSWIDKKRLSCQNENVYLWPVKATEDARSDYWNGLILNRLVFTCRLKPV